MKRIAVCLSGCLRSWEETFDRNRDFWNRFKEVVFPEEDTRLYYFLSFWEFNVPCGYIVDEYKKQLLSSGAWTQADFETDNKNAKLYHFLDKQALEDVGWGIEATDASMHSWEEFQQQISKSRNRTRKEGELWWESPAFLMRESLRLKRKWELSNGPFDLVFWTRFDAELILEEENLDIDLEKVNLTNSFTSDAGNTFTGVRDLMFFGKSGFVDYAANLYPAGNLPFDYPPVNEKAGYTVVEQVFRNALEYDYVPLYWSKGIKVDLVRSYCENRIQSFLDKQLIL